MDSEKAQGASASAIASASATATATGMEAMTETGTWVSTLDESEERNAGVEDGHRGEIDSRFGGRIMPVKYRGTVADQIDMRVLGKKQVLRRNFGFYQMLALASTVVVSWEILLPLFTFVLTDGGTPLLFWGHLVCAAGLTFVYASLAEIASMSPTAGGQYHWVSEFSPPKMQKMLSYTTGWVTAMAWQVYLCSVTFVAATAIQGLIALNHDDYVWQYWHGTLLTIAISAFAALFNVFCISYLPVIEILAMVLHIAALPAIVVPLWVLKRPLTSGRTALLDFTNNGGWPTTGLSSMIGLTAPLALLIGYDCSVHMAEEIEDASATLPRVIMWSLLVNAALALVMVVTLAFTIGDVESIVNTRTNQPFIQLFYNATGSLSGTNAMVALLITMFGLCCISEVATASRQLWAFARDHGLPLSTSLSKVTPGWDVPMRAIFTSFVITSVLSCLNLGTPVALNAFNSLGAVAVIGSYFLTISCVIHRRIRGPDLPPRRWSLGRYGLLINVTALAWLTPVFFFSFWPLAQPVTAMNMNWSSVMFCGVLAIASAFYVVRARHVYIGPVVLVKRLE